MFWEILVLHALTGSFCYDIALPATCEDYTNCKECANRNCNNATLFIQGVCKNDDTDGCICIPGLTGSNCGSRCDFPKYGIACKKNCTCEKKRCDPAKGCTEKRTLSSSLPPDITLITETIASWTDIFTSTISSSNPAPPVTDEDRPIFPIVIMITGPLVAITALILIMACCLKRTSGLRMKGIEVSNNSDAAMILSRKENLSFKSQHHTNITNEAFKGQTNQGEFEYSYIEVDVNKTNSCKKQTKNNVSLSPSYMSPSDSVFVLPSSDNTDEMYGVNDTYNILTHGRNHIETGIKYDHVTLNNDPYIGLDFKVKTKQCKRSFDH